MQRFSKITARKENSKDAVKMSIFNNFIENAHFKINNALFKRKVKISQESRMEITVSCFYFIIFAVLYGTVHG